MKKDDENPSLDVDLVTVVQLLYATVTQHLYKLSIFTYWKYLGKAIIHKGMSLFFSFKPQHQHI